MSLAAVLGPRDLTVGEGPDGGLLVHRVHHPHLPLRPGDWSPSPPPRQLQKVHRWPLVSLVEVDGKSVTSVGALELSQHLVGKCLGSETAIVAVRRRHRSTPTLLLTPDASPNSSSQPSPPTSHHFDDGAAEEEDEGVRVFHF